MKRIILFCLMMLLATTALARQDRARITGNMVLKRCQAAIVYFQEKRRPKFMYDIGWCLGFVKGLSNGFYIGASMRTQKTSRYCLPENVTVGDQIKSIVKYLKSLPKDKLKNNGSALAMFALFKTYPCNSTSRSSKRITASWYYDCAETSSASSSRRRISILPLKILHQAKLSGSGCPCKLSIRSKTNHG